MSRHQADPRASRLAWAVLDARKPPRPKRASSTAPIPPLGGGDLEHPRRDPPEVRGRSQQLDGLAVCLAQAMCRAGEHLAREAGQLIEQRGELALADDNKLHVGIGGDRRIAGGIYEERKFPERAPRSESGDFLALAADACGPFEDHEELVAALAFAHDRGAGRNPPVLGPAGHLLAVLARTRPEERGVS